jgi:hypothetical protein
MMTVPHYTGSQQSVINTRTPAPPWESGPGVMPPNPYPLEPGSQSIPPPIQSTDLWSAQQVWPL